MRTKLAVTLLFVSAISLAACQDGNKPATEAKSGTAPAAVSPPGSQNDLQSRQNAYKSWRRGYDSNIADFDNYWKTWRGVFKSFTNGTGNRFSAYTKLKNLSSDMDGFRESIAQIKAPAELTDSQRKNLDEAYTALRLATGKRVEAIHTAMEMLDSGEFKPSVTDKIQSDITEGDTFMLLGWTKVYEVESELNLLQEPKKNKKKIKEGV